MTAIWDDLPSPVEAAATAQHIRDRMRGLRFTPEQERTAIRPVVLPAETRTAVHDAMEGLVRLLHKICWSLTDDPRELVQRAGLLPYQVPLLGAGGTSHEIEFSASNARGDTVLRDGVPLFVECNFGVANGGPVTAHYLIAAYRDLFGMEPTRAGNEPAEPLEGWVRMYERICAEKGLKRSVVNVGTMRDSDIPDRWYYDAESEYLKNHGFESAFVEPEFFDSPKSGRPSFDIGLKNFLPEDWRKLGISWDGIARAHQSTLFMVPDSGLALSSKLVLAWLSEGSVPLTADERAFVDRHIPWTRLMRAGSTEHEGTEKNLIDLAVMRQRDFVLKPINSAGGKGVMVGRSSDPGEWKNRLQMASETRDHVLQEYVQADHMEMDYYNARTGRVERTGVSYILGPYAVDGICSGSTIRHVPLGKTEVVSFHRGACINMIY
ncbi:hypothetical protein [Streptomyces sp. MUM 2J]|uniref:hypothetical protein n=1 Tax=Streptomyces sp. MUM 2J TaxID=2791987 RepID=UPI001F047C90|nr:hypothetical protein [Streptomyces sp. MUM 2J]MCH0566154.1 hypothetical protein [Streptomyces sp. MUM 2J]